MASGGLAQSTSAELGPWGYAPNLSDIQAAQTAIMAASSSELELARTATASCAHILKMGVALAAADSRDAGPSAGFRVVATSGSIASSLDGRIIEKIETLAASFSQTGGSLISHELESGGLLIALSETPSIHPEQLELLAVLAGIIGPVRGRILTQNTLDRERLLLQATSELSHTGQWHWDPRTTELTWSPEMFEITGVSPQVQPTLELWQSLMHPQDRFGANLIQHVGYAEAGMTESIRLQRKDGTWHEVKVWARTLHHDSVATAVIGSVLDVTATRQAELEVEQLTTQDALTGLPNRRELERLTQVAISALPTMDAPDLVFGLSDSGIRLPADRRDDLVLSLSPEVGLILIDLDRFRLVNSTQELAITESVLQEIGQRLTGSLQLFPLSDCTPSVARVGGDEFVVLLPWVAGLEAAMEMAQEVLEHIRLPIQTPTGPVVCEASIGVSLTNTATKSAAELFQEAELAMYAAKNSAIQRVQCFAQHMRTSAQHYLAMERILRDALTQDKLVAVYQPIVKFGDQQMVAVEALVRIQESPDRLIQPDDFLQIAEETGLIVQVDRWMLDRAIAAVGHWRTRATGDMAMQVNVSAKTLASAGFVDFILSALKTNQVPARELRLELTESTLVPMGSPAQRAMIALTENGIQCGIDDFGTGYSSLAYLQELPVSFLKVDRMFVARLDGSDRASAVARTIIELAHAHGLRVTAEGVETQRQAELLQEMGCDYAQGWLFGRPTFWEPANELVELDAQSQLVSHHW